MPARLGIGGVALDDYHAGLFQAFEQLIRGCAFLGSMAPVRLHSQAVRQAPAGLAVEYGHAVRLRVSFYQLAPFRGVDRAGAPVAPVLHGAAVGPDHGPALAVQDDAVGGAFDARPGGPDQVGPAPVGVAKQDHRQPRRRLEGEVGPVAGRRAPWVPFTGARSTWTIRLTPVVRRQAAAVAASPVISDAGLVMISPSNTSPRLTSDLAGNANPDYHAGYFRVSSNDLHQARALSDFVYNQLELRSVATVHDGDPYTSALVAAFADEFSALGGNVPAQAEIEKGDTGMREALEQFAVAGPDAIFFPLFITEGSAFAAQARAFDGLEGTTLISAAALLVSAFLETPQSEGIYFAGPESDFRSNVNEVTGRSGEQVLAAFEASHGGFPGNPP